MVLIVFGQLTNLILFCNTFYVTFLFPLETPHILTLGVISSALTGLARGGGRIHKKQRRDVEPGPDFTPLCNFCCQTAVLSEEAFGMSQRPDLQALGLLDRRGILEKLCLV